MFTLTVSFIQCASVMNLFDISQNFITNGPNWLSQDVRPQSARATRTRKEKMSSFNGAESQETAMKMKSE